MKLGTARLGWIPSFCVLAAIRVYSLHFLHEVNAYESYQWRVAYFVCFICEGIRLFALWTLPRLWYTFRISHPERTICETFSSQLLSFLVSIYTLKRLSSVCIFFSSTVPFLQTDGDIGSIAELQHMTVILGTYVIVDTCHLLRTFQLVPNPAMLLHHFIFGVILSLGLMYPQYPEHYRIHVILFGAELSTPFLNLRWILRWVFEYQGIYAALLSIIFVISFTMTRIGLYGALIVYLIEIRHDLNFPKLWQNIFCVAVIFSYFLNIYWLEVIMKNVARMTRKKQPQN